MDEPSLDGLTTVVLVTFEISYKLFKRPVVPFLLFSLTVAFIFGKTRGYYYISFCIGGSDTLKAYLKSATLGHVTYYEVFI